MANLTQELIAEQANAPIAVAIAAADAAGIDATAHPDPANPRAALVRYTTRINRGSFEVPFPYLDHTHLFAWGLVSGDWLEMTPRFIGPQTVYLPVTFDMEQVVIYRHTPRVVPTPPDGTPVTAEDLNRILLHSRYVIEEIGGALAARPSYCKMLPPGPPVITLFDVAVIGGVEAVVTWEVTGETDTITLNGVPVAAGGVQSFPLAEDTEFTIVAENVRGSASESGWAMYTPPVVGFTHFNSALVMTNDNRTMRGTNTQHQTAVADIAPRRRTGKYYFEVRLDSGGAPSPTVGLMTFVDTADVASVEAIATEMGTYGVARRPAGARIVYGGYSWDFYPPAAVGSVIGMAVDFDNNAFYFSVNGVWAGDPAANTGGTTGIRGWQTLEGYFYCPAVSVNSDWTAPSEARATISLTSGTLTYPPPTGFSPWA